MVIQLAPRIVVDLAVRFGRPVIEGTRVPVETVLAKMAGGMTASEVAGEYELTEEDVRAALHYAALALSGEEVRGVA
jgi:uncharacterized protein (DUF433 family)